MNDHEIACKEAIYKGFVEVFHIFNVHQWVGDKRMKGTLMKIQQDLGLLPLGVEAPPKDPPDKLRSLATQIDNAFQTLQRGLGLLHDNLSELLGYLRSEKYKVPEIDLAPLELVMTLLSSWYREESILQAILTINPILTQIEGVRPL